MIDVVPGHLKAVDADYAVLKDGVWMEGRLFTLQFAYQTGESVTIISFKSGEIYLALRDHLYQLSWGAPLPNDISVILNEIADNKDLGTIDDTVFLMDLEPGLRDKIHCLDKTSSGAYIATSWQAGVRRSRLIEMGYNYLCNSSIGSILQTPHGLVDNMGEDERAEGTINGRPAWTVYAEKVTPVLQEVHQVAVISDPIPVQLSVCLSLPEETTINLVRQAYRDKAERETKINFYEGFGQRLLELRNLVYRLREEVLAQVPTT